MAANIGLSETLQLVLGTGFVTTILNQAVGWWVGSRKEAKEKRQEATYLALQIAVILEAFAISCAERISSAHYHMAVEYPGNPDLSMPTLESYPTVESWSLVSSKLATRILSFPNILELGRQEMTGWWDEGDPEDRTSVMLGFLGKYGLHAWTVSVDLRKEYKLPAFSPRDTSWDAIECLRKEAKRSSGNN